VDEFIESDMIRSGYGTNVLKTNKVLVRQNTSKRCIYKIIEVPSSSVPVEKLVSMAGKVLLLRNVTLLTIDFYSLCSLRATKIIIL